ncbi:hypothetical protein SNE40_012735 [Patella caerulea]|uniref:Uncharacterized protein n=1 Tax=Patella caerulea TaxID=87958 RepID=A0AAN8PFR0_PATCE
MKFRKVKSKASEDTTERKPTSRLSRHKYQCDVELELTTSTSSSMPTMGTSSNNRVTGTREKRKSPKDDCKKAENERMSRTSSGPKNNLIPNSRILQTTGGQDIESNTKDMNKYPNPEKQKRKTSSLSPGQRTTSSDPSKTAYRPTRPIPDNRTDSHKTYHLYEDEHQSKRQEHVSRFQSWDLSYVRPTGNSPMKSLQRNEVKGSTQAEFSQHYSSGRGAKRTPSEGSFFQGNSPMKSLQRNESKGSTKAEFSQHYSSGRGAKRTPSEGSFFQRQEPSSQAHFDRYEHKHVFNSAPYYDGPLSRRYPEHLNLELYSNRQDHFVPVNARRNAYYGYDARRNEYYDNYSFDPRRGSNVVNMNWMRNERSPCSSDNESLMQDISPQHGTPPNIHNTDESDNDDNVPEQYPVNVRNMENFHSNPPKIYPFTSVKYSKPKIPLPFQSRRNPISKYRPFNSKYERPTTSVRSPVERIVHSDAVEVVEMVFDTSPKRSDFPVPKKYIQKTKKVPNNAKNRPIESECMIIEMETRKVKNKKQVQLLPLDSKIDDDMVILSESSDEDYIMETLPKTPSHSPPKVDCQSPFNKTDIAACETEYKINPGVICMMVKDSLDNVRVDNDVVLAPTKSLKPVKSEQKKSKGSVKQGCPLSKKQTLKGDRMLMECKTSAKNQTSYELDMVINKNSKKKDFSVPQKSAVKIKKFPRKDTMKPVGIDHIVIDMEKSSSNLKESPPRADFQSPFDKFLCNSPFERPGKLICQRQKPVKRLKKAAKTYAKSALSKKSQSDPPSNEIPQKKLEGRKPVVKKKTGSILFTENSPELTCISVDDSSDNCDIVALQNHKVSLTSKSPSHKKGTLQCKLTTSKDSIKHRSPLSNEPSKKKALQDGGILKDSKISTTPTPSKSLMIKSSKSSPLKKQSSQDERILSSPFKMSESPIVNVATTSKKHPQENKGFVTDQVVFSPKVEETPNKLGKKTEVSGGHIPYLLDLLSDRQSFKIPPNKLNPLLTPLVVLRKNHYFKTNYRKRTIGKNKRKELRFINYLKKCADEFDVAKSRLFLKQEDEKLKQKEMEKSAIDNEDSNDDDDILYSLVETGSSSVCLNGGDDAEQKVMENEICSSVIEDDDNVLYSISEAELNDNLIPIEPEDDNLIPIEPEDDVSSTVDIVSDKDIAQNKSTVLPNSSLIQNFTEANSRFETCFTSDSSNKKITKKRFRKKENKPAFAKSKSVSSKENNESSLSLDTSLDVSMPETTSTVISNFPVCETMQGVSVSSKNETSMNILDSLSCGSPCEKIPKKRGRKKKQRMLTKDEHCTDATDSNGKEMDDNLNGKKRDIVDNFLGGNMVEIVSCLSDDSGNETKPIVEEQVQISEKLPSLTLPSTSTPKVFHGYKNLVEPELSEISEEDETVMKISTNEYPSIAANQKTNTLHCQENETTSERKSQGNITKKRGGKLKVFHDQKSRKSTKRKSAKNVAASMALEEATRLNLMSASGESDQSFISSNADIFLRHDTSSTEFSREEIGECHGDNFTNLSHDELCKLALSVSKGSIDTVKKAADSTSDIGTLRTLIKDPENIKEVVQVYLENLVKDPGVYFEDSGIETPTYNPNTFLNLDNIDLEELPYNTSRITGPMNESLVDNVQSAQDEIRQLAQTNVEILQEMSALLSGFKDNDTISMNGNAPTEFYKNDSTDNSRDKTSYSTLEEDLRIDSSSSDTEAEKATEVIELKDMEKNTSFFSPESQSFSVTNIENKETDISRAADPGNFNSLSKQEMFSPQDSIVSSPLKSESPTAVSFSQHNSSVKIISTGISPKTRFTQPECTVSNPVKIITGSSPIAQVDQQDSSVSSPININTSDSLKIQFGQQDCVIESPVKILTGSSPKTLLSQQDGTVSSPDNIIFSNSPTTRLNQQDSDVKSQVKIITYSSPKSLVGQQDSVVQSPIINDSSSKCEIFSPKSIKSSGNSNVQESEEELSKVTFSEANVGDGNSQSWLFEEGSSHVIVSVNKVLLKPKEEIDKEIVEADVPKDQEYEEKLLDNMCLAKISTVVPNAEVAEEPACSDLVDVLTTKYTPVFQQIFKHRASVMIQPLKKKIVVDGKVWKKHGHVWSIKKHAKKTVSETAESKTSMEISKFIEDIRKGDIPVKQEKEGSILKENNENKNSLTEFEKAICNPQKDSHKKSKRVKIARSNSEEFEDVKLDPTCNAKECLQNIQKQLNVNRPVSKLARQILKKKALEEQASKNKAELILEPIGTFESILLKTSKLSNVSDHSDKGDDSSGKSSFTIPKFNSSFKIPTHSKQKTEDSEGFLVSPLTRTYKDDSSSSSFEFLNTKPTSHLQSGNSQTEQSCFVFGDTKLSLSSFGKKKSLEDMKTSFTFGKTSLNTSYKVNESKKKELLKNLESVIDSSSNSIHDLSSASSTFSFGKIDTREKDFQVPFDYNSEADYPCPDSPADSFSTISSRSTSSGCVINKLKRICTSSTDIDSPLKKFRAQSSPSPKKNFSNVQVSEVDTTNIKPIANIKSTTTAIADANISLESEELNYEESTLEEDELEDELDEDNDLENQGAAEEKIKDIEVVQKTGHIPSFTEIIPKDKSTTLSITSSLKEPSTNTSITNPGFEILPHVPTNLNEKTSDILNVTEETSTKSNNNRDETMLEGDGSQIEWSEMGDTFNWTKEQHEVADMDDSNDDIIKVDSSDEDFCSDKSEDKFDGDNNKEESEAESSDDVPSESQESKPKERPEEGEEDEDAKSKDDVLSLLPSDDEFMDEFEIESQSVSKTSKKPNIPVDIIEKPSSSKDCKKLEVDVVDKGTNKTNEDVDEIKREAPVVRIDKRLIPPNYCWDLQNCKRKICKFIHNRLSEEVIHYQATKMISHALHVKNYKEAVDVYVIAKKQAIKGSFQPVDQMIPLLNACFMLGYKYSDVAYNLLIFLYISQNPHLNDRLCCEFINMCSVNREMSASQIGQVFDIMKSLNLLPSKIDSMITLLMTFYELRDYNKLFQIMIYLNECEFLCIPLFIREATLLHVITHSYHQVYLDLTSKWIDQTHEHLLLDLNKEILLQLLAIFQKLDSLSTIQKLEWVLHVKPEIIPEIEEPDIDREEAELMASANFTSEELQMNEKRSYMHRIQGCKSSCNWEYLAQIFIDLCNSTWPRNSDYIDGYIDTITAHKLKMEEAFHQFLTNIGKYVDKEKTENVLFEFDQRSLSLIGSGIIHECCHKELFEQGSKILFLMLKWSIKICEVKPQDIHRSVQNILIICSKVNQPKLAVEALEGLQWLKHNMSPVTNLGIYIVHLNELIKCLVKKDVCKQAFDVLLFFVDILKRSGSDIEGMNSVRMHFPEIVGRCLTFGILQTAIDTFELFKDICSTRVGFSESILRSLFSACYEIGNFQQTQELYRYMYNSFFKKYALPNFEDPSQKKIMLGSRLSHAEIIYVLKDCLMNLYRYFCTVLETGTSLTMDDLNVTVEFVRGGDPDIRELFPYLSSIPQSEFAAHEILRLSLAKLEPSLETNYIPAKGCHELSSDCLKEYLLVLDLEERNIGLRFDPPRGARRPLLNFNNMPNRGGYSDRPPPLHARYSRRGNYYGGRQTRQWINPRGNTS